MWSGSHHAWVAGISHCILLASEIDHLDFLGVFEVKRITTTQGVKIALDVLLSAVLPLEQFATLRAQQGLVGSFLGIDEVLHALQMAHVLVIAGRRVPLFADFGAADADGAVIRANGPVQVNLHRLCHLACCASNCVCQMKHDFGISHDSA